MVLTISTRQTSRIYGVLQTILLCVFAAAVLVGPGSLLFPTAGIAHIAASVLCAGGLILLLLAFGPIRRAIQIAPEPQACATLVTRGVYKRFRHPIYTSIVMLVGGLFLRKPTIVVGIAAAVVIVFLMTKVEFEERLLLAHYPEYSEYKSRTWGIVPCRADDRTGRHHHLVDPG